MHGPGHPRVAGVIYAFGAIDNLASCIAYATQWGGLATRATVGLAGRSPKVTPSRDRRVLEAFVLKQLVRWVAAITLLLCAAQAHAQTTLTATFGRGAIAEYANNPN